MISRDGLAMAPQQKECGLIPMILVIWAHFLIKRRAMAHQLRQLQVVVVEAN